MEKAKVSLPEHSETSVVPDSGVVEPSGQSLHSQPNSSSGSDSVTSPSW